MKQYQSIVTHVFVDDLLNNPVTIITGKVEGKEFKYVTKIETLPVFTFRGNGYSSQILETHKDHVEAWKYHQDVVRGKK